MMKVLEAFGTNRGDDMSNFTSKEFDDLYREYKTKYKPETVKYKSGIPGLQSLFNEFSEFEAEKDRKLNRYEDITPPDITPQQKTGTDYISKIKGFFSSLAKPTDYTKITTGIPMHDGTDEQPLIERQQPSNLTTYQRPEDNRPKHIEGVKYKLLNMEDLQKTGGAIPVQTPDGKVKSEFANVIIDGKEVPSYAAYAMTKAGRQIDSVLANPERVSGVLDAGFMQVNPTTYVNRFTREIIIIDTPQDQSTLRAPTPYEKTISKLGDIEQGTKRGAEQFAQGVAKSFLIPEIMSAVGPKTSEGERMYRPEDFTRPSETWGEKTAESVGGILPYVMAGPVTGAVEAGVTKAIPALTKNIAGRMLSRAVGRATLGLTVKGSQITGKALLDPEYLNENTAKDILGELTDEALIMASFGAASVAAGEPIGLALSKALPKAFEPGLRGFISRAGIIGGRGFASGAVGAIPVEALKIIRNPDNFDLKESSLNVLSTGIRFAVMDLATGLRPNPPMFRLSWQVDPNNKASAKPVAEFTENVNVKDGYVDGGSGVWIKQTVGENGVVNREMVLQLVIDKNGTLKPVASWQTSGKQTGENIPALTEKPVTEDKSSTVGTQIIPKAEPVKTDTKPIKFNRVEPATYTKGDTTIEAGGLQHGAYTILDPKDGKRNISKNDVIVAEAESYQEAKKIVADMIEEDSKTAIEIPSETPETKVQEKPTQVKQSDKTGKYSVGSIIQKDGTKYRISDYEGDKVVLDELTPDGESITTWKVFKNKLDEYTPASEFEKHKSYEGVIYKNYHGGKDLILKVEIEDDWPVYTVKDLETGNIRTHRTIVEDKDIISWPDTSEKTYEQYHANLMSKIQEELNETLQYADYDHDSVEVTVKDFMARHIKPDVNLAQEQSDKIAEDLTAIIDKFYKEHDIEKPEPTPSWQIPRARYVDSLDKIRGVLNLDDESIEKLYKYLKRANPRDLIARYKELFQTKLNSCQIVRDFSIRMLELLDEKKLSTVQQYGPTENDLSDICKAIEAMSSLEEDVQERIFCAKLFSNSKRFNDLRGKISKIIREFSDEPFDEEEDVIASMGVIKNTAYAFIKGDLTIKLNNQVINLGDYGQPLALSDTAIKSIDVLQVSATSLYTIETHSSFHRTILFSFPAPKNGLPNVYGSFFTTRLYNSSSFFLFLLNRT